MKTTSLLATSAAALLALASARAQTKDYTGANNQPWATAGNWNPSGAPGSSDSVTVANGNTVRIQSTTAAVASSLTLGGASAGGVSLFSTGTNSLTVGGNITLAPDAGAGTLTIDGTNNTLTLNGGAGSILNGGAGLATLIIQGGFSGSLGLAAANVDDLNMAQTGAATLTITSGQTYNAANLVRLNNAASTASAATINLNGGTLNVGSELRMNSGTYAGNTAYVNINSGGRLTAVSVRRSNAGTDAAINWNDGTIANYAGGNLTLQASVGAGNLNLRLAGTGTHTFEAESGRTITVASTAVLADKVGENGTLRKTGAGSLVFQGTNTYTGLTMVENGTLVVTNAVSSTTISSNSVAVQFTSAPAIGTYPILAGPVAAASLPIPSVTVAGSGTLGNAVITNSPNLAVVVSSGSSSGGTTGVTILSAANGPWTSGTTWSGGVVPAMNDIAKVNHAVSLAAAAAYQLQLGTVGTIGGALTLNPGGSLQTTYNSAIGFGNRSGSVVLKAGSLWTNGGRVQICARSSATGSLTMDGGRYASSKEVLFGGSTFTNSTGTLAVINGGEVVLGSYIRFTSGTNSTYVATIGAGSSLECAYLWFDDPVDGSLRSLTVNGGRLTLTAASPTMLTGASAKLYFEGGQIVFSDVDSLYETEQFAATWNAWVDGGQVDSARFTKAELKQFLAWDGTTAVVNDFAMAPAAVRPANIFDSGCVLQRGQTNRVWGTATPGDTVTVAVRSQSLSAVADAAGKWMVTLASETAGGPFTMTMLVPGKRTVTLTDVYFGDVWILTGQSNMFQPLGAQVGSYPDAYPPAPDAADDLDDMRFMIVGLNHQAQPAADIIPQQSWTRWQADRLGDMSTVGYFFGRYLRQQLHAHGVTNIPIGLIKVCRGGSGVEEWMDAATLDAVKPSLAHPEFLGANASLGYNGMLAPFQNFAIKGALWYQGESSGSYDARQSPDYPPLVNALVTSWRSQWNNPDLAFYFVQLAAYLRYAVTPADETWPWMREQQAACLATPGTRMAIALDGGLQWQVHPPYKDKVGERLARIALSETYGIPTVWRGPTLQNVQVNGPEVTLTFSNVAAGLQTRAVDSEPDAVEVTRTNAATGDTNFPPVSISANRLGGFALAGTDGVFRWATEAHILSANQIRLANRADVPAPVHVRYAFQNYPRCNLFNSEGLPAEPFRTDTFAFGAAGGTNSTPVNAGLADRTAYGAKQTLQISLADVFDDIEDGAPSLTLALTQNSNPSLVAASLAGGNLNLGFTTGQAGTTTLSVRATDSGGKSTTASFTLTVETETYLAWRHEHFSAAELADAGLEATLWEDRADPDKDGFPNLFEYALALNPRQSEAAIPTLTITDENGLIKVCYRRSKQVAQDPSVSLGLEKTASMAETGSWSAMTDPGILLSEDQDSEWREIILATVNGGPSPQFVRIRVSRQP